METENTVREKLFTYVKENTYKDTSSLDAGTMIFAEGIFDSMGFALLLDFLEETFSVGMDDEDLVEENFESIDAITKFIMSKSNPD